MLKLAKINSHQRDINITFDEEPHIYYVKEKPYNLSVTSFIHSFFEEFDSKKIVDKFYDKWQEDENSKYFGLSKDEIINLWEENGKKQSHYGTLMHQAIEDFYNELKPINNSKEFMHFINFYKDHKHLKPYRTEWMVYAEDLKLAGSIDMVFEEDGVLHIYDWKRSKEIKEQNRWQEGKYPLKHLPDANFWHYSLQLNCYKYILENYYDKKVNELCLVILHPNNENYIKLKVPVLKEEVEAIFKMRKESLN